MLEAEVCMLAILGTKTEHRWVKLLRMHFADCAWRERGLHVADEGNAWLVLKIYIRSNI